MREARFKRVRRYRSRFQNRQRDAVLDDRVLEMRGDRIAGRYGLAAGIRTGGLGIRRRIDRYHYGRRPLEFTRSTAITLIAALVLMILCGIAAYRESASFPVTNGYHAAAGS
jgi:hypothetical protein